MANKRMFCLDIVNSDAFLDMPLSAQALYFHLGMRADDDGFIGNPKSIQRLACASQDDLMLLITRNSDYGIVSTYFASNRVFAVERELVEDYDCYNISNAQLVVDSLICVDNS